jgi:hypothetical protein
VCFGGDGNLARVHARTMLPGPRRLEPTRDTLTDQL